MAANQKKIKAVKEQYEQEWLAIKEVVAIGIGKVNNEMGIIISVSASSEKLSRQIPAQVADIPIKIQQTGQITAQ